MAAFVAPVRESIESFSQTHGTSVGAARGNHFNAESPDRWGMAVAVWFERRKTG